MIATGPRHKFKVKLFSRPGKSKSSILSTDADSTLAASTSTYYVNGQFYCGLSGLDVNTTYNMMSMVDYGSRSHHPNIGRSFSEHTIRRRKPSRVKEEGPGSCRGSQ